MSDGIIRLCREHDMELRQLGAHQVCPHGHTCDVDWYVLTPATRPGPSLPLPVVQVTAPRGSANGESKPRTRRKIDMPQAKVEHPHGTRHRYWRGCRCQPCKDALASYQREKKGKAPRGPSQARKSPGRTMAPRVSRTMPPRRGVARPAGGGGDVHALGGTAAAIVSLREQLRAAEAEFRSQTESLFPDWSFAPSVEAR
jgi:hypothetical protein